MSLSVSELSVILPIVVAPKNYFNIGVDDVMTPGDVVDHHLPHVGRRRQLLVVNPELTKLRPNGPRRVPSRTEHRVIDKIGEQRMVPGSSIS
jgi:hypothetical protein